MTQENVDPAYKYIDNKFKLLKREINQLKIAHDAIANQHANEILDLKRIIAVVKINNDVNVFSSIINNHQFTTKNSVGTQLLTEASSIKAQIFASNDPLQLAIDYHTKWDQALRNLGLNFISF